MRPGHRPERQNHISARAGCIISPRHRQSQMSHHCHRSRSNLANGRQRHGSSGFCRFHPVQYARCACQCLGDMVFTAFFRRRPARAFTQFQNRQAGNPHLAAGSFYAAVKVLNQRHFGAPRIWPTAIIPNCMGRRLIRLPVAGRRHWQANRGHGVGFGRPHFLNAVKFTDFRPKNMNHNIAVDQHPVAG